MFSNELQLLISCVKSSDASHFIPANINWEKFSLLARKHRLTSLVCHALKDHLPPPLYKQLNNIHRQQFQKSLMQHAAASKIQNTFHNNAVSVLFFKGMVIQQWLYPPNGFRQSKDIDILVPASDVEIAIEILQSTGYRLFSYKKPLPKKIDQLLKLGRVDLKLPDANVIVELHWQLWGKRGEIPTNFDHLWHHRQQYHFGHTSFSSLNSAIHLCYLCYHGTSHFWYRIFWLRDIYLALCHPDTNWLTIIHHAKSIGVLPSVTLACVLCKTLFDVSIPKEVVPHVSKRTYDLALIIFQTLEENPTEADLIPKTPQDIYRRLKWKWQIKSKHRLRSMIKLL